MDAVCCSRDWQFKVDTKIASLYTFSNGMLTFNRTTPNIPFSVVNILLFRFAPSTSLVNTCIPFSYL